MVVIKCPVYFKEMWHFSASGFWWKALDTERSDQAVLGRKGLLAWPIAICSLVFKGHPDLRKALHSVPESITMAQTENSAYLTNMLNSNRALGWNVQYSKLPPLLPAFSTQILLPKSRTNHLPEVILTLKKGQNREHPCFQSSVGTFEIDTARMMFF